MKQQLHWLHAAISGIIVLFIVYACNKVANRPSSDSSLASTDVTAIKSLLSTYAGRAPVGFQKWIDSLSLNLDFAHAGMADVAGKKELIAIPIKVPVPKNLSSDKLSKSSPGTKSMLLIYKGQAGGMQLGNIVQLTPSDKGLDNRNPGQLITDLIYNNGSGTSYNGYITSLNLFKQFNWERKFEDGKMVSESKMSKKPAVSGNKQAADDDPDGCTDYYMVYTLYVNGIAVDQEWDYIATQCISQPGDGGAGSGGGADDSCEQTEEDNFNLDVSNAQVASDYLSSDVGTIDALTKYKNPTWRILKGGGGGWSLRSHENGKVKLVDVANNTWAWVTLSHGSIDMIGSAAPGTGISYTQGAGTPSFTDETAATSNILYGGMSLQFVVTYTFICDCPVVKDIVPPINTSYTSNALWDANPND